MTDTPPPQQVGRYRIERTLGQGGMGRLYLATDPVIGRQLAIKLIRDELADPELRARFLQEARAAGGLQHPNVVTVFDAGEHEGHPFIAMEYVEGDTLSALIKAKREVPLSARLHLLEQLGRGLASAHRAGLVHRDVKPANLMVDREGTLKVLDFGIARVAESGLTSAGVAIGTINYMSPEQVAGQTVDFRSDVFSVGVVMHELLSYQPAFPGTVQDGVMYRIVHGQPASLRELCPELPAGLFVIVERAIATDPAGRYQDLELMADEIAAVRQTLGDEPLLPAADAEGETLLTPSSPASLRTTPPSRPVPRPPAPGLQPGTDPALAPTATSAAIGAGRAGGGALRWVAGAGGLILLVAAGLTFLPTDDPPAEEGDPVATTSAPVSEPAPPPSPPASPLLAAETDTAATEPASAEPATADPITPPPTPRAETPPPSSDPVMPNEAGPAEAGGQDMVANLRRQAATALAAGNREQALASLTTLLQLQAGDPDATALLDQLLETARREAAKGRDRVPPAGQAIELFSEGDRLVREADTPDVAANIRQLWTARTLFDQAATALPASPAEESLTAPPSAADAAPPPAAPATDPRAEVIAVLDRYWAALAALDTETVREVYPSVPDTLVDSLGGFESYSAALDELAVEVTGETATATGQLRLQVQPRAGSAASASGPARFELRRQGPSDWIISGIDLSSVRPTR